MSESKFTRKSDQLTGEPADSAETVEKPKRTRVNVHALTYTRNGKGLTHVRIKVYPQK